MLGHEDLLRAIRETDERVSQPVIEEVRRSTVTNDHHVIDFMDPPGGQTGLVSLAVELDALLARQGDESVPGRYLAIIHRESLFRVAPQQGIFLWNVRFRLALNGEHVLAAPFVMYRMAFDGRLHAFAHRFDRERDGVPAGELTKAHVRQHLLDSFTFYLMHAIQSQTPYGWPSQESANSRDVVRSAVSAEAMDRSQQTAGGREHTGKIRLKYVGNFAELGYDDTDAPSLVASRGKRRPENKQRVVEYLRSATAFIVSPGRREDIFDPSKSAGSASVATDGVYVWPRALAYYVDNYDVELPAEFESHMARRDWKPPTEVDKLALELPG